MVNGDFLVLYVGGKGKAREGGGGAADVAGEVDRGLFDGKRIANHT